VNFALRISDVGVFSSDLHFGGGSQAHPPGIALKPAAEPMAILRGVYFNRSEYRLAF
jgi:hypothetical protein